uniref:Uncharacterized protein n=1 Tax=Euplotes harpa TaxID=151035 RepID=A0A7S3JAB5_9SPIT|mmetsp:Transcript_2888/g.3557  ORF Transcript_2888/g.3557 Transcript_2888/m.3557 type:complete len:200 (+) Transcript_2888:492-1091(+)
MDFLDKNDCVTTLKKINIAVIEKDKHKEFQEEWINCFTNKYNTDLPSSDEEAAPEVSSDSEEETKVAVSKKPVAQGAKKDTKRFAISSSDDEDAKVQPKKQPVKKLAVKDSDSDSDSLPPVKKNLKGASKAIVIGSDSDSDKPKASQKKNPPKSKKVMISSDSDSESDDDKQKKKPAKKSNVKNAAPKKKVKLSSSDSD